MASVSLPGLYDCEGMDFVAASHMLLVACGGAFGGRDQPLQSGIAVVDLGASPPRLDHVVSSVAFDGHPVSFGWVLSAPSAAAPNRAFAATYDPKGIAADAVFQFDFASGAVTPVTTARGVLGRVSRAGRPVAVRPRGAVDGAEGPADRRDRGAPARTADSRPTRRTGCRPARSPGTDGRRAAAALVPARLAGRRAGRAAGGGGPGRATRTRRHAGDGRPHGRPHRGAARRRVPAHAAGSGGRPLDAAGTPAPGRVHVPGRRRDPRVVAAAGTNGRGVGVRGRPGRLERRRVLPARRGAGAGAGRGHPVARAGPGLRGRIFRRRRAAAGDRGRAARLALVAVRHVRRRAGQRSRRWARRSGPTRLPRRWPPAPNATWPRWTPVWRGSRPCGRCTWIRPTSAPARAR